jgi:Tat protein secretion system quality control protein TatD with DNase activity
VVQTSQMLAELHNVAPEAIATATTRNFCRLFNLPPGMGN